MDTIEKLTCHKRTHVLSDIRVEADLSGMTWFSRPASLEEQAKVLERAVKEFEAFLRDHRSQDMVRLDVQRIYSDLCSNCGDVWESDFYDGAIHCAACGAMLVETPNDITPDTSG